MEGVEEEKKSKGSRMRASSKQKVTNFIDKWKKRVDGLGAWGKPNSKNLAASRCCVPFVVESQSVENIHLLKANLDAWTVAKHAAVAS